MTKSVSVLPSTKNRSQRCFKFTSSTCSVNVLHQYIIYWTSNVKKKREKVFESSVKSLTLQGHLLIV